MARRDLTPCDLRDRLIWCSPSPLVERGTGVRSRHAHIHPSPKQDAYHSTKLLQNGMVG